MSTGGVSRYGPGGDRWHLTGLVLSAAVVLTFAILATQGGGDESDRVDTAPRIVGLDEVLSVADSLGHPLYWAGPQGGEQLELTEEASGSVYLRYLPEGVEAGDSRAEFLTVGTYPVADAQSALRRTAARAGSKLGHVAGGGLTLVNPQEPTSVYLAYPQSDLQLEVYDPKPGRSLSLIRSGAIRPAG